MLFVGDLMTRDVLTVRPTTPIRDVAMLLVEHRISGVPVVDERGSIVGVVSEGDLVVKAGPEAVDADPWLGSSATRPRPVRSSRRSSR